MKLETERLEITALTPEQLALWVQDLPALEKALDCSYQAEPVEGIFKEIVAGQAAIAAADPDNYLWHTFWFVVRKSDRCVVGSIDFKSPHNDAGEVEIGYGLGEAFEHCGYMTETVAAFCRWALQQSGVQRVIAETEKDNLPSHRVLTRCGFEKYAEGATLWWRLNK